MGGQVAIHCSRCARALFQCKNPLLGCPEAGCTQGHLKSEFGLGSAGQSKKVLSLFFLLIKNTACPKRNFSSGVGSGGEYSTT